MSVHVFGIRHHGPGCARSLKAALAALAPDIVLVEGPPDADVALPFAAHEAMQPPVALLVASAQKERIRSVEDLAGKTVGIPAPGTPEELALRALLEKAGMKTAQVTVQSYGDRRLAGPTMERRGDVRVRRAQFGARGVRADQCWSRCTRRLVRSDRLATPARARSQRTSTEMTRRYLAAGLLGRRLCSTVSVRRGRKRRRR